MEPTLPKSEDPSRTNEFQKTKVNAENIFAQLELIRRKQVELTLEHINLALGEDSTRFSKYIIILLIVFLGRPLFLIPSF